MKKKLLVQNAQCRCLVMSTKSFFVLPIKYYPTLCYSTPDKLIHNNNNNNTQMAAIAPGP